MQIIKDKAIVDDSWIYFDGEGALPSGDVIVSLEVWQNRKNDMKDRKVGLFLQADQNPRDSEVDFNQFDVIAINFPTFMDGRGYSHAKILRDRMGYKGEIRATGDVMRDQIFYMQRCGFTAYELKPGKDIQDAVKAFDDFTVKYQVSSDEPLPIYRRR